MALLILVAIGYIQYQTTQWDDLVSFIYVSSFIQVPLVILAGMLFKSKSDASFKRTSFLAKAIMATGILSMAVFYISNQGIGS
jgi:hypothetical protein